MRVWLAFAISGFALASGAVPARADVYLRANAGWLKGNVYETPEAGSPFLPGGGGSVEAGLDLSSRISFGVEFSPYYAQPRRNIPEAEIFEDGRYRYFMGNFALRMEPVERIQPYFILGGGLGIFTFDYGPDGAVLWVAGANRLVTEESLNGWIGSGGFGFDSPVSSHLSWGMRARYLFHRWRGDTSIGRFLPHPSGSALSGEASLTLRF